MPTPLHAPNDQTPAGIIFDLDGTLADTMPAHFVAWTEICNRHGLDFPEDRFYRFGGMPSGRILEILIDEAGKSGALDPAVLAEEKEDAFTRHLDAVGPIPEVIAVARSARDAGLPIGVATGGHRRIAEPLLANLGIAGWFGCLVTAEDTDRHKPDPAPFLRAAELLSLDPAACDAYEDTDLGLQAIAAAGMRGIDIRPLRAAAHADQT